MGQLGWDKFVNVCRGHGYLMDMGVFKNGDGPPTLEYAENLMASDGVTLLVSLPMEQSTYLIMRCLVATLLGTDQPTKKLLAAFGKDMRY